MLVLTGIGIADFSMKIFQSIYDPKLKSFFLFIIFLTAFLFCLLIIIINKIGTEPKALIWGAFLGIPNVLSSYFLIDALDKLPAVYVYPTVNITVIILTTLIVRYFWKEKILAAGWLAILTGIIAVILLTAGR